MRLVRVALIFLSMLRGATVFAFGELTLLPSYNFGVARFDFERVGLYIEESVTSTFLYSSWTGSGRVFLRNTTIDEVRWIQTQQDLNYTLTDRIRVGAGVGFGYSDPTDNKEVDLHLKATVRLW